MLRFGENSSKKLCPKKINADYKNNNLSFCLVNKEDVPVKIPKRNRWHIVSKLTVGGFVYNDLLFP